MVCVRGGDNSGLWTQAIAAKQLPKDSAALGQRQAMAQKWVAMDRETKLIVRKVIAAGHPQLLVRCSESYRRHALDPALRHHALAA